MSEVTCGQCQQLFQVAPGSLMAECPHCGVPMLLSETSSSLSSIITSSVQEESVLDPSPSLTTDEDLPPQTLPFTTKEEISESELVNSIKDTEDELLPHEAEKQFLLETKTVQKKGVSGQLFFLVLCYASLVTIAFAYYFWMTSNFNPNVLENLPDVEPIKNKDGIIQSFNVPQDAPMPKGHTLKLGESRRFGDVIVTPLKVTREPIQFVYYDGSRSEKKQKPPTGDVLKLWMKFENVSKTIPLKPLGRKLTYFRSLMICYEEDTIKANQFVCQLSEKVKEGNVILLYDLVFEDVWDLQNQNIDHELKPGESFETYLPSKEESIETLTGELVWRVHFRKGYHHQSLRGVTTLIEVRFSETDITTEQLDLQAVSSFTD